MLFCITYFILTIPINLTVKGETTKKFRILKIAYLGCSAYLLKYISGDKTLKCVNCGYTEFTRRLGKDGYSISWKTHNDRTGEAICSDCEGSIDLVD